MRKIFRSLLWEMTSKHWKGFSPDMFHSFTITAMAFQDAGNPTLSACALATFMYSDGRFVPFCAYYLTKQA